MGSKVVFHTQRYTGTYREMCCKFAEQTRGCFAESVLGEAAYIEALLNERWSVQFAADVVVTAEVFVVTDDGMQLISVSTETE